MTNSWKIPDFVGWIFFREINYPFLFIDCTHANTGLFTGIFVMVLVIISLIVFFVLINQEKYRESAIAVASWTELILYGITSLAVLVGMCQVFFWKIYIFYFFRNFHLIILFFLSLALSGSKTLVWQFAKIGIRQFTVGRCPNRSLHLFSFLHNWLFLRNARSFNVLFGFPGNPRANYIANRFHFGCFQVRNLPLKNKIGSIHANLIPYWLFFEDFSRVLLLLNSSISSHSSEMRGLCFMK